MLLGPRGCAGALAVLGLVITAPVEGAAPTPTPLQFSHYGTEQDAVHSASERFEDLVEAGTSGMLEVVIHTGDELGNQPSVLQGVRLGTIDIAVLPNPALAATEPGLAVLDLPFLFQSPQQAHRVLDGEIGRAILDQLEAHGMKGLALWEVGFRNLTNTVRPVRAPGDLKGLKIWTPPESASNTAFELLGALPMPLRPNELHMALAAETLDGAESTLHRIRQDRLFEVQKHLSLTRHGYTAAPLVMNLAKFSGLPADQRKVILEAALEAAEHQRALNDQLEQEALREIRAAGVEIVTDPDVAAFRAAIAAPVRQDYIARHGDGMLEQIDLLQ